MNKEIRSEGTGHRESGGSQAKNASIRDHRDLVVWQKAMSLTKLVYRSQTQASLWLLTSILHAL